MAEDLTQRSENLEQVTDQILRKWNNIFRMWRWCVIARRTGGGNCFSAALFDKKGDGAIFTSIFGRDEARFYGKPVKGGKSEYSLSEKNAGNQRYDEKMIDNR